jgi:plasmid maintenance system antidote protein VapI
MPMKNPPHPGDFIRTEIIKPAGLSVHGRSACIEGFAACAVQFA